MKLVFIILFGLHFIVIHDFRSSAVQRSRRQFRDDNPYFYDTEALKNRRADYAIHPLILGRRSLRMMSGEEMTDEELFPLFEAARWAPSHHNVQEWRFVYAKRNTREFSRFVKLLSEGNQKWASDASALIVLLSNKYNTYKGEKNFIRTHSFDTGAAWMAMALEGTARGYVVHAMSGFDYDRAARVVGVSKNKDFQVEAMIAIGKRSDTGRSTSEKTSQRNAINKFISKGTLREKK